MTIEIFKSNKGENMTNSVVTLDKKELKNLGFIINEKTDTFTANIITVNGILSASQQKCIGEAAEKFGNGRIKLSTSFTIEVQGITHENLDKFRKYIAKENLQTGGVGNRLRPVVSCIGTDCRFGLADTMKLSTEIHERIYNKYRDEELPHRFKVAISGCPNDCTKITLCEIGIMSQYIPDYEEDKCRGCNKCSVEEICPMDICKVEDKKMKMDKENCKNCGRCIGKCYFNAIEKGTYGYKVFIGGKGGKIKTDARPLDKIFTSEEEIFALIERAILFYKEKGEKRERFAKTIERIGFEEVMKILTF